MKEKTWFKFYPDKWMGDLKLRVCSHSARALLIDLMAISFPSGYFILPKKREKKLFLRQIGFTFRKFESSLSELLDLKRVKFDEESDRFFIPKMVKDHENYLIFSESGHRGAKAKAEGYAKATPEGYPEARERTREREEKEQDSKPLRVFISSFERKAIIRARDMPEIIPLLKAIPENQYESFLSTCDTEQQKLTNKGLSKMGPEKLILTVNQLLGEINESGENYKF